jgi:methionine-rich copper-binding protein CopC
MNRFIRPAVLAAVTLFAGPAFAHAFLTHADPAVGSEQHQPPSAVTITFTEAVEPSFSTIEVNGPTGRIDTGTPHTLGDGRQLAVALPKIAPGTYTVVWHVTSVDTHKTQGSFTFTVVP